MPENASGRYWVIRHPASGGQKKTVAQFDSEGETEIPDRISNHDEFLIQEVARRSALVDSVDQSGLSQEEKDLLRAVFPTRD